MSRRRGRTALRTSAPREITLIIAVILWIAGFLDVILGAFSFPNNLGIWFLVISGLLLILGSLVEGI